MTRVVPTHIPAALGVLTTEYERFAAERDAFAAFHDRLDEINQVAPTFEPRRPQAPAHVVRVQATSVRSPLQDVRRAYRETVMDVSHYTDEYDESLVENLAAEFTPEIATAVVDGEALSSPLHDRLRTESQQASEQRRRILRGIATEREEVEAAHEHIQDVQPVVNRLLDTSVQTFSRTERRKVCVDLRECEQRCDEMAAARQASLRTTRMPGPRRGTLTLEEYLYQALSVTHPVLADLAEVAEMSRTIRHRIERVHQPTNGETTQHIERPRSSV